LRCTSRYPISAHGGRVGQGRRCFRHLRILSQSAVASSGATAPPSMRQQTKISGGSSERACLARRCLTSRHQSRGKLPTIEGVAGGARGPAMTSRRPALLVKCRKTIRMHFCIVDRTAFSLFANRAEVRVRVDHRLIIVAVAHVLRR